MDDKSVVVMVSGGVKSTYVVAKAMEMFRRVYPVHISVGGEVGGRLRRAVDAGCELVHPEDLSVCGGEDVLGLDASFREENIGIAILVGVKYVRKLRASGLVLGTLVGDDNKKYLDLFRMFSGSGNIYFPLGTMSYRDIVWDMMTWNVPFGQDLYRASWSCERGGDLHCGMCRCCGDRKALFATLGCEDPTIYAG